MLHPEAARRSVRSRRGAALLYALLVSGAGDAATGAPPAPAFEYAHPARTMPPALPGEASVFSIESGRGHRSLTLRQLKSLPAVRYRTTHMQLRQDYTYEGVTLRDLARLGGFAGQDVTVAAANGFAATITADDYMKFPIMLAYAADGRPISTLKKGPLTVVLPAQPERFHRGAYAAAWVWFAERIAPAP